MKKIIDKRNYIILVLIIILIISLLFNPNKTKEHIKTFYHFNETITIKIYSDKKMKKTFKEIDNIYDTYANQKKSKELFELGENLYYKTNGLIDITEGLLIQNIQEGREYNFVSGFTTNNFDNLNYDSIIGAYATSKVVNYLNENNIDKYIINQDGNIVAGKHYNNSKYRISITNQEGALVDIAQLENMSMATKGNVNEFKPYMVNPTLSKISSENKLVVVITKNINEANYIANTLYLLGINEGKKYIKDCKAEALWQTSDGKIYTTEGFNKYLQNQS